MKTLPLILIAILFSFSHVQAQTTFTVNSTGDATDNNLGDGICDTGIDLPGPVDECTLRAAIAEFKNTSDPNGNAIGFNIPTSDANHVAGTWTISPTNAYPSIDFPVNISTLGQAGTSCNSDPSETTLSIIVDGTATPAGTDGFVLTGDHYQVLLGLSIGNFPRDGIAVGGTARKYIDCNTIGLSNDGTTPMPNGDDGIDFANFTDSTVVVRNLISNNGGSGIEHAITLISDQTYINSNFIGTDHTGLQARPNGASGIAFFGTKAAHVGQFPPFSPPIAVSNLGSIATNVISGNAGNGISGGGTGGSSDNVIEENYIGLGRDRVTIVANGSNGIALGTGHNNNVINRNYISGNLGRGIQLGATKFAMITNNYIGTNHLGADLGNSGEGIYFGIQGDDNVIQNNQIAFNSIGIWIGSGAVPNAQNLRNSITGNSIYSNDGLGIDIEPVGLNANDPLDADTGSNNLQNSPVISNVALNFFQGGGMDVTYSVDSDPANSAYPIAVQFYRSDSSNDEMERFIGSDSYTLADFGAGGKTRNLSPPFDVNSTDFIGATATDANGNTSEISVTAADVQLPVELVDFQANFQNETLQVSWRTLTEENNSGFELEYRAGMNDVWSSLAWLVGQATTLNETKYSFETSGLSYASGFLRLRQIDLDGRVSLSPIIEISNEIPEGQLLVNSYPNPTNGYLSIDMISKGKGETVEVKIFDMMGQEVKSLFDGDISDENTKLEADMTGLPSGVYSLHVVSDRRSWTESIVLIR